MKAKGYRKLVGKLLLVAGFLFANTPARAQGLPEGEGLKVVIVSCTQCHGLDRLTDIKMSAVQWENALYDMIARGAVVEGKDLLTVRKYLIDNFATDRN
jgi:hypothetical protein